MYKNDLFYPSTRKNKKWMVQHNGKWVHFGDNRYEDFTQHGDLERQRRFLSRNWKWEFAKPYTPASLAFHVLWNQGS